MFIFSSISIFDANPLDFWVVKCKKEVKRAIDGGKKWRDRRGFVRFVEVLRGLDRV